MKTKIYKVKETIPFTSSIKVFYVEVEDENVRNIKKIRKEDIRESIYAGFYDLTKSLKKGDYFILEG